MADEDDSVSRLFEFICEKCPQQLRSIQIHKNSSFGDSRVIYDHDISIIAEQIKFVQILRLGQNARSMFQFQRLCNLQTLFIQDLKTVSESFWNQKLPKLRIVCVIRTGYDHVDLKKFFKNNKQLKVFHVFAFMRTWLPALTSTEDSLSIISLSIGNEVFGQSWANFEEFCNREMVSFVELKIHSITKSSAINQSKNTSFHYWCQTIIQPRYQPSVSH